MNLELVFNLKETVKKVNKNIKIMEVCGTHTMEIGKLGIRNLLGEKIQLISGPGCPVCVTPSVYIDYLYSLSVYKQISIITYGDMLRVPGTSPNITLENARALGGDIKIVYSAIDSIEIAKEDSTKKYVFVAIGFETTIPSTCILIKEIQRNNIENLYILSLHKKVEPVVRKLLEDKELKIDGFLCPGNVAVIIGESGFEFLEEENEVGVISGFSDDEIISSIIMLIKSIVIGRKKLINNYRKFVGKRGNLQAIELISDVFSSCSSLWRGLGEIDDSGYRLKDSYRKIDILEKYGLGETIKQIQGNKGKYVCMCGDILTGRKKPYECNSFGKVCNPNFPIGPCMVSSEGTCAAYYKYELRW